MNSINSKVLSYNPDRSVRFSFSNQITCDLFSEWESPGVEFGSPIH